VDGLERDLKGHATVLRLDLLSKVGKDAANLYGVKVVPSVLLFDGNGELVLRQSGKVDADPIRDQVAAWVTE
jgi:thioredoxin-related protein